MPDEFSREDPLGSRTGDEIAHIDTEPRSSFEDAPAMTRSEEELVLSARAVARERVRLVKRIVTETVTTTTEVRREELHVERVPLDGIDEGDGPPAEAPGAEAGGAAEGGRSSGEGFTGRLRERLAPLQRKLPSGGGSSFGHPFEDETLELSLMEEEVVVTKRVVPRERVRLRKEVVTEQRPVHDTLRKEQIVLERDDAGGVGPSGGAGLGGEAVGGEALGGEEPGSRRLS